VGFVVGAMGLLAFANGVIGRALKPRRLVEQVQQMVAEPDDLPE